MRGGAALELFGGRGLLSVDLSHSSEAGPKLHAGAEYWIQPGMALRVGVLEDGASYNFV